MLFYSKSLNFHSIFLYRSFSAFDFNCILSLKNWSIHLPVCLLKLNCAFWTIFVKTKDRYETQNCLIHSIPPSESRLNRPHSCISCSCPPSIYRHADFLLLHICITNLLILWNFFASEYNCAGHCHLQWFVVLLV